MKAWLIVMGAVVGLVGLLLFVPARAEAQSECLLCEYDIDWKGEELEEMHRFDSSGESQRLCEGSSQEDLLPEPLLASDPASDRDGKAQGGLGYRGSHANCHNDWVEGSSCDDWPHGPCGPGFGLTYAELHAEVDQLVASLGAGRIAMSHNTGSHLAARVADVPSLLMDDTRRTLRLSDCKGRLITEWAIPVEFWAEIAGSD